MIEHKSGARRSEAMPRFDLLPKTFLVRVAKRFEEGQSKYGENNWKLGLPFDDTFNHLLDHLYEYRERRKMILQVASELQVTITREQLADLMQMSETDGDDLAAAGWAIATLMEMERTGRLE